MVSFEDDDLGTPSTIECAAGLYVTSFQSEHFHRQMRYHWTICRAQKPDELVSWGHAPTQKDAELAARNEVSALCRGLSQGGRVVSSVKPWTNRCNQLR